MIGFAYSRLPEQSLKLTVMKLDGSSFDVQVGRSATVGELKVAVEGVFSGSPKEGEGKISWSHVWSHFCLCYGDHKLIDHKIHLRTFGIKDGDQLHFIRHASTDYIPQNSKPKSLVSSSTNELSCLPISESRVHQECPDNIKDGSKREAKNYELAPYVDERFRWDKDKEDIFQHTRFIGGWLSYTKLWCRVRSVRKLKLSRFGRHSQRTASR